MEQVQKEILSVIADIDDIPTDGAYNIRINGKSIGMTSTEDVRIVPKPDNSGMDIYIAPGTKKERIHIPVVIDESGLRELVYNDFYVGEGADVSIVAGCGIHNHGDELSRHDGIHTFNVSKNARVVYIEKHYGSGDGRGERVLNPVTVVNLEENGYMEMDTVQIKGVDRTKRVTTANMAAGSVLKIREKLMTNGTQYAETEFEVNLNGKGAAAHVVSRSVAADESSQLFISRVNGNEECTGRTECDAIIMNAASVKAVPEISANHVGASLVHEATIGKIAGDQFIKLMTLGLTEQEAEEQIVNGFLK